MANGISPNPGISLTQGLSSGFTGIAAGAGIALQAPSAPPSGGLAIQTDAGVNITTDAGVQITTDS